MKATILYSPFWGIFMLGMWLGAVDVFEFKANRAPALSARGNAG